MNFLRQKKVLVTPTMILFYPMMEEETNRVIRAFPSEVWRLIKLSFVNDSLEKAFYLNEFNHQYLGYIHKILTYGFNIGNYQLNFLSYSNS